MTAQKFLQKVYLMFNQPRTGCVMTLLPLNPQLFYKTQALKMHNPVNWIACMPCKTKLYNTKTVKAI